MTKLANYASPKLIITVSLSILVHGAILSLLDKQTQLVQFSSSPAGTASYEVSLVDSHVTTRPEQPETTSGTPARTPQLRRVTRNKLEQAPAGATQPTQSIPNQDHQNIATQQHASAPTLSNDMRRYLETEFRTRFQYPPVARKFGWQGKVVVGLDINRAGYIHNVNVKHSSGYSVLDDNARRTFEDIGHVLPILSRGNAQSYQFTIPVIYKLTKG